LEPDDIEAELVLASSLRQTTSTGTLPKLMRSLGKNEIPDPGAGGADAIARNAL